MKKNLKEFDVTKFEEEIQEEVHRENLKLVDKIQNIRTPFLDRLMVFVTKTGNGGTVWIISCLYLYLIKNMHNQAINLLVVISVCAILVNFVIKGFFDKDRPCDINYNVELLIKRPMGSSLPSAHTATSFACAYVIFIINPVLGVLAYVWAALIGFSRIYLYVHFPSDVVLGMVLGMIIGMVTLGITINYIPF